MGSLFGYEIRSEIELRRLNAAAGTRGTLSVRRARHSLAERPGTLTAYLDQPGGDAFFAIAEVEHGALMSCSATGEYLLLPAEPALEIAEGGEQMPLESRVVSTAAPTLLAMRGDLVLHAAAVEAGGAVVFCGPSERGKTTLANACGALGYPLLTEDGAVVAWVDGVPVVYPGARGVNMRTADGRVSLLRDPGPAEPGPSAVRATVVLDERGEGLEVEPLDPARALILLTPHLCHTGGRDSLAAAFAGLARLLSTTAAFRAALPDDLAALPGAAIELLDALTEPR